MSSIRLTDEHGFSIQFSPFLQQIIGCCTSRNYGLSGGGKVYILSNESSIHKLTVKECFDWPNGLYDISWSQNNENFIVSASADGSLQLWEVFQNNKNPVLCFKEHTLEVSSVDMSFDFFASGSWDGKIKVWNLDFPTSLMTFTEKSGIVHSVKCSFFSPNLLASTGSDSTLTLWDRSLPTFINQAGSNGFNSETLDCDWSKHNDHTIATTGSDGLIRIWDIRRLTEPQSSLSGHQKAVRRVKWSPHFENILASSSYDFTTIIWNVDSGFPLERIYHHSAFVYGLDFNNYIVGEVSDFGWDSLAHVFTPNVLSDSQKFIPPKNKL